MLTYLFYRGWKPLPHNIIEQWQRLPVAIDMDLPDVV